MGEKLGICSKCGQEKILVKGRRWCKDCKNLYSRNRANPSIENDAILKTCPRCKNTFPQTLEYFYPDPHCKFGLDSPCKKCRREASKVRQRKRLSNRTIYEQHCKIIKERRATPAGKEKRNAAECRRRANNINALLAHNLRNRLLEKLRIYSITKTNSYLELLGCSVPDFIIYLESKFQIGMTWQNRSEWHIDHIKPCASFNLQDVEEQKKCFHYTNLQPLWAKDNLKKYTKIEVRS